VKKINNEILKAIFTKGNQEDRRSFLVRLFGSLRFTAKITKRGHDGKTGVSVGVRGGADF
jgi:hypothetical protein